MAPARDTCRGFSVGDWWVPPFELRYGEALTLGLPPELTLSVDDLIRHFTGETSGAVKASGKVIWAEPAQPRQGVRRWLQGSSASGWLRRAGGVSADEARAILQRLRIDRDDLRVLAGNPRLFIALEAAWARGAGVLVFATGGLDPLGRKTSFEMVKEHLSSCPAVYLSFPYEQAGASKRDIFPAF